MGKEIMIKQELLEAMQSEWQNLLSTLERLSETQMLETGVEEGWNVKDILAHITAWESRMVRWIDVSLRGDVPDRPAPGEPWDDIDLINQQIYIQNKDVPLPEVLEAFHDTHKKANQTVALLNEQDLFDPGRFAWRKGDPLWHMVADNTCWHYKEHNESIQKWLNDL
jgi:hypothetical protein